ncbi:uncharacterized protein BXZ73DRAFT_41443 [Epithele typhae]|uniref:uncharacterized protein n=1 Tax=Epithele typhae TaxID=378194 RepID=UPI0020075ABC|nr:uncharacterized protein BXZ73DRAFT_41443 [Epithele typhae]KAH9941883.1 hypothetical protein BXZ73DRAFT_41443 [Epithele typhae]
MDLDSAPIPFQGDFFGDHTLTQVEDHVNGTCCVSPIVILCHLHLRSSDTVDTTTPPGQSLSGPVDFSRSAREQAEKSVSQRHTYVVPYPVPSAGAPIAGVRANRWDSGYRSYQHRISDGSPSINPYAPFASRLDWEIALWAKTRGTGSTAFLDLLAIEDVAEKLSLSFKNSGELNRIIDSKMPPGPPPFQRHEVSIAGETFEMFFRDVLECIKALFGDPEFAPLLLLTPERHYSDEAHTDRVYFDMNTGKWWWAQQKRLEKQAPGATVIPVIISSDKTQLTQFGSKVAYPVYLTIGNLPKHIRCKPSRQGQILLAYLPATRMQHVSNKASRRRVLANLFHTCLSHALAPLRAAGADGIPIMSGDGVTRRGHPLLACYVGDYPEQVLVTGCKTGECPKCPIPASTLGDEHIPSPPLRNLPHVLNALATIEQDPRGYSKACSDAGIKPLYHPFWESLPHANIYMSITPDVLHQLHQGVLKHLIAWLKDAFGTEELDARCQRLPPNHNARHFGKGISCLSRVTGQEHAHLCRILLGLVIHLRLPGGRSPIQLLRATRALLDFLYLAQYPTHTSTTLRLLDGAIKRFHDNKQAFVDLGIRVHFHLPKLHSADHYSVSIELFGTTDNYDTQFTERLHIVLTKDGWRASNHKDELPQMTRWVERKEKMLRHSNYVNWRLQAGDVADTTADSPPARIQMTRHPSTVVRLGDIVTQYGAKYFRDTLSRYIVSVTHPHLQSARMADLEAGRIYLNFAKVPVFHKIKFALPDPHDVGDPNALSQDAVHICPVRENKKGRILRSRFDTVLVRSSLEPGYRARGMSDLRVAQVRVVFSLPPHSLPHLFPGILPSTIPLHLAYVEWFSCSSAPDPDHGLFKVVRSRDPHGARIASVIPVEQIERSCQLFPDFGHTVNREWTSNNVLELCSTFYLNTFLDKHTYKVVY